MSRRTALAGTALHRYWCLVESLAVVCAAMVCSSPIASLGRGENSSNGVDGGALADAGVGMPDWLGVLIVSHESLRVEIVTLRCVDGCFELQAVPSGGSPPYQLTWDDGSSAPVYRFCPEAAETAMVSATDTALQSGEFRYESRTATAHVSADGLSCSESADPPPPLGAGACDLPPQTACTLAPGISLPEDVVADLNGASRFYAGAAPLPAGRYRVSYVGGCYLFGIGALTASGLANAWTVHEVSMPAILPTSEPLGQLWLVKDGAEPIVQVPGTAGLTSGDGAFATYEECVAANCALPAVEFDFTGGSIGLGGTFIPFGNVPNVGGDAVGGTNPTYRLTRLGCP